MAYLASFTAHLHTFTHTYHSNERKYTGTHGSYGEYKAKEPPEKKRPNHQKPNFHSSPWGRIPSRADGWLGGIGQVCKV